MKIAAAAYPIDWLNGWDDYTAKITAWVEDATGQGGNLLVFPEYGAMELASLAGPQVAGDLALSLTAVSEAMPQAQALHSALAQRHGVHILSASAPVVLGDKVVNRAHFHGPDGRSGHQDKLIMTRFERDPWGISSGDTMRLFDTALGRIGVLICYDCEFPLLARAMVEAGAQILLVPSCTETLSGYWRVRIGAMARALEGQCVVVHSPTVGSADWSPAVDANSGAAAIYGPPDRGWPDNGILALGGLNHPGWVVANCDLARVADVRADGRVLNLQHWPEQLAPAPNVDICAV